MSTSAPTRGRLPQRRRSVRETIRASGQSVICDIGLDVHYRPKEVFLCATKQGTDIDSLLADIAVVISVALQHGISAEALSKSVGRIPAEPLPPKDLDNPNVATLPASAVGAVLDLIRKIELDTEEVRMHYG